MRKMNRVRVLAVDSSGMAESADVVVPDKNYCVKGAGSTLQAWEPTLVDITPLPDFYEATVSWVDIPVGSGSHPAKYIVRWEDGDILCMILTNQTSVSIPVRPGSKLRVEISLSGFAQVSQPLTISSPDSSVTVTSISSSKLSAAIVLSVFVTALVLSLAMLAVLGRVYAVTKDKLGPNDTTLLEILSPVNARNKQRTTKTTLTSFESFLENNNLSGKDLGFSDEPKMRTDFELDMSYIERPNYYL